MKKGRSKMNQRGGGGGGGGALAVVLAMIAYLLFLAAKGVRTQRIIDISG
tara:strand:+ start:545 stop:694 length:150 start_codon:yes stop_codon:yes gene_type:complete